MHILLVLLFVIFVIAALFWVIDNLPSLGGMQQILKVLVVVIGLFYAISQLAPALGLHL